MFKGSDILCVNQPDARAQHNLVKEEELLYHWALKDNLQGGKKQSQALLWEICENPGPH
jgi:hypothetical protein